MSHSLLGIYLNDHLLGASGGLELFKRAAGAQRGTPRGPELERLVEEVREDRDSLLRIMRGMGVPVRRAKVLAGWVGEKVGRAKLNGHLLTRSPLSSLVELEAMRLGVQGKEAGWLALRQVADAYDGLDAAELERLVGRARQQGEVLERLRQETAAEVLSR